MNFKIRILNKIKVSLVVFFIGIIGGAVFFYQKFFGGKVQTLPDERYIVGPSQELPTVKEMKQENKVAIAYA